MEPEKKSVTTTKPSFTTPVTKTPAPSKLLIRNVQPTYNADGTPVLEPLTGSFSPPLSKLARRETVIALRHRSYSRGESVSPKRGRPKKYGLQGCMQGRTQVEGIGGMGPQGCMPFSSQFQHSATTPSLGGSKAPVKRRGRPLGMTKKHKMEAPLGK